MKTFLALIFALALNASAATITTFYLFTDFNVNTQQVKRVVQTPLQAFADYNGAILTPTPVVQTTDTNGYAYFSNTVAGYSYKIQIDTVFGSTVRTCGYPSTISGTVNGRDYLGDIRGQNFYYLYTTAANVIGDGTQVTNVYGRSYGPSVLALPTPFAISASDWNPIVVAGAGTAAANGNYYQASSNVVAGLPYAVWTNSTGSAYRLVLNNTNVVPSGIYSNTWTIESPINVNFAYDLIGPGTFYGTWEGSTLGGAPGADPPPIVGNKLPGLISASASAANGTLTLSPGTYDIQGYVWYPTNLTVVANGAIIIANNGLFGMRPEGSFSMVGGSFSNGNVAIPGAGSLCVNLSNAVSYVSFRNTSIFGSSDVLAGTVRSENFTLSLIGCEIGTFWDAATFARLSTLSNVVFSAVGCKFYSVTNGLSTSSIMISSGANQSRISGCYLEQGVGFTGGAGVLQSSANTTNEINGCVIVTRNGLAKVQQSAGTVIVDGMPYDVSDYLGNITFTASAFSPTNLATAAPNFRVPWSILSVAVSTSFTAPTGVDMSGRYMQIAKMYVTNSAAGTITLTMPANVVSVGSTTVTRRSILEWQCYGGKATNCIITPVN